MPLSRNVMQARVASPTFCLSLLRYLNWPPAVDPAAAFRAKLQKRALSPARIEAEMAAFEDYDLGLTPRFNIDGWDAMLTASALIPGRNNEVGRYILELAIVLQPVLAEDYATVYVRMRDELPKRHKVRRSLLLIDEFAVSDITLDEARDIFATADIRLVRLGDL